MPARDPAEPEVDERVFAVRVVGVRDFDARAEPFPPPPVRPRLDPRDRSHVPAQPAFGDFPDPAIFRRTVREANIQVWDWEQTDEQELEAEEAGAELVLGMV